MASGEVLSVDKLLVALLDRIVREMLGLAFDLRATTHAGPGDPDAARVIEQLDAVVRDIQATVVSWQFGEERGAFRESPGCDDAPASFDGAAAPSEGSWRHGERAVSYLRHAGEALEQPSDGEAATADGGRRTALNHVVHRPHVSIGALQDAWPDPAA